MNISEQQDYFPKLDALRALAVGTVFIGHFIPISLLQQFVAWGDIGVILFFCLSGFLITGILLRIPTEGGFSVGAIKNFYGRRVLRIAPIYYLTILIALAVGYEPAIRLWPRLATFTLHFPGLPATDNLGAFSHFWSLSIEEQFYLFWPFLVILWPRQHLVKLLIGIITAAWIFKFSAAMFGGSFKLIFRSVFGCLDSLCLGSLLAAWRRENGSIALLPSIGRIFGVVWFSMTLIRIVGHIDPWYRGYLWFGVIYFAVAAIWFTALIGGCLSSTVGHPSLLQHPLLIRIGKISYGLYVYHFFVMGIVGVAHLSLSPFVQAALIAALSVGVSTLSWFFIESPILSLKRYFVVSQDRTVSLLPQTLS